MSFGSSENEHAVCDVGSAGVCFVKRMKGLTVPAKRHSGSDVAVEFFTDDKLGWYVDRVGFQFGSRNDLEGAIGNEDLLHLLGHRGMYLCGRKDK